MIGILTAIVGISAFGLLCMTVLITGMLIHSRDKLLIFPWILAAVATINFSAFTLWLACMGG